MKRKEIIEGLKDPKDNPCWKGYKPVGTKKKAGKTVPNCVPESAEQGVAEDNTAKITDIKPGDTATIDTGTGVTTTVDLKKNPTALTKDPQSGKLKLTTNPMGNKPPEQGGQQAEEPIKPGDEIELDTKEAAGDQAAPDTIDPPKVPEFPQVPEQDGDLGQGMQAMTNKDGTKSLSSGQGTFTWDKNGKPLKYSTPAFNGVQQTVDMNTGDITVNYGKGPMAASQVYDKTGKKKQGTGSASYDLGIAKLQTGPEGSSATVRGDSPEQDRIVKLAGIK